MKLIYLDKFIRIVIGGLSPIFFRFKDSFSNV